MSNELRQQLAHWIEHLAHVLPAQAPIRDFVHHNTLHGLQHLPFAEALAAAQALTGAQTYWPEARFRDCLASGRITQADLAAALAAAGVADLDAPILRQFTRREVLLASLQSVQECPESERLAWLGREEGVADAAIFAHFQASTAAGNATNDEPWPGRVLARWAALCQRLGKDLTWRALLEQLSGEDVLERIRGILQRQLAAHLDLGVAAWTNPARAQGFFAAWRDSAGYDLGWEMDELPNVRDEILHLPSDPVAVLAEELPRLLADAGQWPGYLQRLSLELPGWSGMFLWRSRQPPGGDGPPVAMADYLAVRVLLERLLCEDLLRRLSGEPLALSGVPAYFQARPAELLVREAWRAAGLPEDLQGQAASLVARSRHAHVGVGEWQALAAGLAPYLDQQQAVSIAWQLTQLSRHLGLTASEVAGFDPTAVQALHAEASRLSPLQRGQIWLMAYERHYREQLFAALAANQGRATAPVRPSAQVVMCMDDREEGTRRHLEEVAPEILTYGAAGFFGVPIYWQGLDDVDKTALCPVVVQPTQLVRERPASAKSADVDRHVARRERRLRWRERFVQTTRHGALAGPWLSALGALPALTALVAGTLAPAGWGAATRRWRESYEGRLATRLELTAEAAIPATPAQPQLGLTDAEQIERVAAFLQMIGLTADFAPLVLFLGHGSSSRNNPHRSAYDCGACSGRHGGPNARIFATMANRPVVRAGLAARGVQIPETTWFVAAEHDTCSDNVDWYDLASVPAAWQGALDTLVGQLAAACRAHAVERCRRLASAPPAPTPWQALRHVQGRAHDIGQARPELGHATNAAAFVGRRQMSRGLFLDRRVFLISYDPTDDAEGTIVENILLAAGPVGAGIALEYYFSSVDNARFGCGSKITHNLTGLFGVMEGADSDLRTGLPWQMVEIHEPMRLLVVVEQDPALLTAILQRQPPLQELINNEWIILAAKSPSTAAIHTYCPRRGWLPWTGSAALPQVACSADWFAGQAAALPPALLGGGAP